jgi:hypothetical protein
MAELLRSPDPFFGRLEYHQRDAQGMRETFGTFDDKESIDSLGVGAIRDASSDQLFPCITSIQTRAQYLLFVSRGDPGLLPPPEEA